MPRQPSEPELTLQEIPSASADLASAVQSGGEDEHLAQLETQQVGSNKSIEALRRQALEKEHGRTEDFRDHFSRLTTIALYILALGLFCFGVVWCWHVLAPCTWRWLLTDEIQRVQNLVTGGVLAGLISDQFRRRAG